MEGGQKVGIREAKIQLSRLIRLVRKGGEIILTDRGRPVARIVPFARKDLPLSERIESLEERGFLGPHCRDLRAFSPLPIDSEVAQKLLHEDRSSGS